MIHIKLSKKHIKVFVAMSGGVDSATTAAILKDFGFSVVGVYMKNWQATNSEDCPIKTDIKYVEKAAQVLDIPWRIYNFEKEYKQRVLDYFFLEYKKGRTPNPDILCNSLVKFDLFFDRALLSGANFIATGHYARLIRNNSIFRWEKYYDKKQKLYTPGGYTETALITALDPKKDQTYFLYRVPIFKFSRVTFPLGGLLKPWVRVLASYYNLPNATRKDSQGICFIGNIDLFDFLSKEIPPKKGKIIDIQTGQIVGEHKGVWFYTIGQRKGLGIGGVSIPYFVVKKDSKNNVLFVAKGHNNRWLLSKKVHIDNCVLHPFFKDKDKFKAYVSLRYREPPKSVWVYKKGDGYDLVFNEEMAWAVAYGQSAVLFSEVPKPNTRRGILEKLGLDENIEAETILKILSTGSTNKYRNSLVIGGGIIEGKSS